MVESGGGGHPLRAFAPVRDVAVPKRFYELGRDSIVEWHAPGRSDGERSFVSLRELEHRIETEEALSPALFIFHCGRCGSTLLGRLLEIEPANRVCLEPNALLRFLDVHGARLEQPDIQRELKTLVESYGLEPGPGEKRVVIKFASSSVAHLKTLRAVFPHVRFVYLLRNPAEVVASNARGLPSFLQRPNRPALAGLFGETSRLVEDYSDAEWCAWYLDQNFRQARREAALFDRVIDYRDFKSGYLALLNEFSDSKRSMTEPAIIDVFSRQSKQRDQSFSAADDAGKVTAEARAIAWRVAGESYLRWEPETGGRVENQT